MDRLDLANLILQVADSLRPAADLRDISISAETFPCEPVFITADPILIEVALRNMLDNAIKYSNPDQIVQILLKMDDATAEISVIDQGRGIEGVNITGPRKRFRRGSNVEDVVGSGLGLAIISEICVTVGGTFSLKKNKGGGTCAHLRLPV